MAEGGNKGAAYIACNVIPVVKEFGAEDVNHWQVILAQVISASSCERNWSEAAHGHIYSKIRNRLEPAITEKDVHVYSKSKMVAATRDADELKMFVWDNEDA